MKVKQALSDLLEGKTLSRQVADGVMAELIESSMKPEQFGALFFGLRLRKETLDEVSGFLDCLKRRAILLPRESSRLRGPVVDVCGTGGDGSGTFNISTTVAFVLAGAGQPVAKHGNRSVSSQSGSFDVLEALGIPFETDAENAARQLEESGLVFLYAPAFHPALKVLAPLRRNLGFYSVLNAIGPLLNPAGVERQLVGVYHPGLQVQMAEVLRAQGAEEAMVVHGADGLDELSLSGPTRVVHLQNQKIRDYEVHPHDFGLPTASLSDVCGGDPTTNARILLEILNGEKGPRRNLVLLNAAAALKMTGKVSDFKEGVKLAEESIDSGRAHEILVRMRQKS